MVAMAIALTGCPAPKDSTAEADLRAEVAKLKAEADAKTAAQVNGAVARTDAAAASAAADAKAAADAQARTAADVAKAEAEVAKAQAEADEAAKSAAAAQASFVDARTEADKAKEVVEEIKTEAEKSQEVASSPSATEADVLKAEADANKLAVEVAKAEAARLKAELARTKARAAAQKIQAPISNKIADFFLGLATALTNPAAGGRVFGLGTSGYGSFIVPPGLPPTSGPWFMNPFGVPTYQQNATWRTVGSGSGARSVITTAQFLPSPTTFPPPGAEVFIDLPSPEPTGSVFEVMEETGGGIFATWSSYTPSPVYATVTTNTLVARAMLPHFTVVALVKPQAGDPNLPKDPEIVTPPPSQEEIVAKANAEAKENFERDKALAAKYVAGAKEAKLAYLAQADNKAAAEKALAEKKAADDANQKRKELADKKIKDLKDKKAKALAEAKAIEKQNRAGAATKLSGRRRKRIERLAKPSGTFSMRSVAQRKRTHRPTNSSRNSSGSSSSSSNNATAAARGARRG